MLTLVTSAPETINLNPQSAKYHSPLKLVSTFPNSYTLLLSVSPDKQEPTLITSKLSKLSTINLSHFLSPIYLGSTECYTYFLCQEGQSFTFPSYTESAFYFSYFCYKSWRLISLPITFSLALPTM